MVAGRSGESDMRPASVNERLRQHAADVRRALVTRSGYGKLVERQLREQDRQEDAEQHRQVSRSRWEEFRTGVVSGGGTTASASGGGAAGFIAPAFLMEQWAAYRSPYAAFVSQCRSDVQLPAYGMEVYLPAVTAATSVTSDTELAGVAETDPTTALLNAPIVVKTGQVVVSQQFLDRVGPSIAGDAVLFQSLREQLDSSVDSYALGVAIAGAQTVTDTGSFSLATASGSGGFYRDLKAARNLLHDTAGVRLRATSLFAIGDVCDYLASLADAQGRPIFTPKFDDDQLPLRAGQDDDSGGAQDTRATTLQGCSSSQTTTLRVLEVTLSSWCVSRRQSFTCRAPRCRTCIALPMPTRSMRCWA